MEEKRDDNKTIKQRIRERYKGVDEEILDVIPAAPQEDFYRSEAHKRVAVYARVSTDDPNQTSSYELQKNHYEDLVNRKPNWELVDIYADEGISGTSLQHRDSFVRMIEDCRAGKIDLIVTKSVSRFARNIIDCIGYVRQLRAAEPPIGVFFETENIFTLDENSEMSLSFIATLAQEESHTKSEIMNASIEMRFKRGIFLTPVLLGYDHDEDGNLIINEEEAKTVRLIFFSYLYGYSAQKIADALTELERLTKRGNQSWSSGSVLQILTNERYCGDVLARKTFVPNYLNHKSKKNNHDRNQYRQKNHHTAIISREDFFAVQKMIRNAKYGNKGYFPEMRVIKKGPLTGFITIHPKWAGFTMDDYYHACDSVLEGITKIPSNQLKYEVKKGSVDLSGYELVRTQFMTSYGQMEMTISPSRILFNRVCVNKMKNINRIELLVNPYEKKIVVRKSAGNSRHSIEWSRVKEGQCYPKIISGSAFLPTIYRLFGWENNSEYKIIGKMFGNGEDSYLMFNMSEAVLLLCQEDEEYFDEENCKKRIRRIKAYPARWAHSFGEKYYESQVMTKMDEKYDEEIYMTEDVIYSVGCEGVTSHQEVANQINGLLKDMGVNDG
ncbi:Site-specific DNA recombinase [Lachnospiraceae bacterium G41]|nr:Site-specific DNA recombinase [Lachnospiraceae bacterium G41]